MIDMHILGGILVALAALVGAGIVLSVTMFLAGSVTKPGPAPHGGIRRDLPQPRPPQPDTDDARVLVLR